MTPAGHLSVSYIIGKSARKISLPAIIAGAIVPDLDFLFLYFPWFNQVHRVISHNVFIVIIVSLLASAFALEGRKQVVGISLLIGASMHLFLDSIMDINSTNGIGIALLWPFRGDVYSPFNILNASQNAPGWSEPFRMFKMLIPGMLFEVPFYAGALFLFMKNRGSE